MLRGLQELEGRLEALNIPFFLVQGEYVGNKPVVEAACIRACGPTMRHQRDSRNMETSCVRRAGGSAQERSALQATQ